MRQVFAVAFDTYRRPIATPVHNLRPPRETCEQCHWPAKFHDAKVRIIQKYSDDEKNSPFTTALLLKVGGNHDNSGRGSGIHWWHMDPINKVSYIADEKRRRCFGGAPQRQGRNHGISPGDSKVPPQELAKLEGGMDCVDCHNRPTHIYRLPEESVDAAIPKSRSTVLCRSSRRKGWSSSGLHSETEAHAQIRKAARVLPERASADAYQQRTQVDAPCSTQEIYSRNVFPR
jgi:hypothetical protein